MSNVNDTADPYADGSDQPPSTYTGHSLSTTGELTVIVLVMTFLLFVMTLIFSFRARRRHTGMANASRSRLRRRRRRLMFAQNQTASLYLPLDPSVLKSLPVTAFRSEDFEEEGGGLDCAVCLSEFADGEESRLLPKCSHSFHVECIDMWFRSNSTCPLCRLPVGPATPTVEPLTSRVPSRKDFANFDQGSSSTSTSSSSSSSCEREKGMPASELPEESLMSPAPLERLRSMRRTLSCRGSDIEQGVEVELPVERSSTHTTSN